MDSNVLFLKYEDMHRVSAQEAVSRARALPVACSPWSVAVGVTQPGLCQTQASGGKVGLRSSECAQRSRAVSQLGGMQCFRKPCLLFSCLSSRSVATARLTLLPALWHPLPRWPAQGRGQSLRFSSACVPYLEWQFSNCSL